MEDSDELFQLCRSVYEATGWGLPYDGKNDLFVYRQDGTSSHKITSCMNWGEKIVCPLYTSDYLLEKLPPALWVEVSGEGQQVALLALNMQGNGEATAVYEIPYDKEFRGSYSSRADTPLEALLKLTLKLHEEKML